MKIFKLLFLFFVNFSYAGQSKFLLISGPSGIGKSTIIKELQKIDSRFVYIKPFTTRQLRKGETDKLHMPLEEMLQLQEQKRLVALNYIYGNYYGTPLDPISEALDDNLFPVLDWPVEKVKMMKELFKDRIISVFLYVEEVEELSSRLGLDSRDETGEREKIGKMELVSFFRGDFDEVIDYKLLNQNCNPSFTARAIYSSYLQAIQSPDFFNEETSFD